MSFDVECPDCGETVEGTEIQKIDGQPDVTVARRYTGFDGSVTSLREMGNFGYMVELPCGCRVYTVN